MLRVLSFSCVFILCIMASMSWECVGQTEEATPVVELSPEAAACKDRLIAICAVEQHRFTPPVREAYLAFAKAKAHGELDAQGKALPDEFLAWVDADPEMEAGVYGVRPNASDVLLMLYSLRLDLGQADFEEYRHLMLASAITHADLAPEADLTPREPLELVIGDDPRQPVDTNDPNRELDMNDHIINFLNSTTIESEHDIDLGRILPGLEYDDRGIAIPEPEEDAAASEGPVTHTRTLYAADVLASEALQQQFNDYMRTHGQEIEIHCGEGLVHWKSRNMVRGEEYQSLKFAYLMFRTAYEAKGLLPAERDPIPSPAERCAYLIRNDKYQFPSELQEERKWPRFPLTAPWPLLTMLVQNDQPLREREERWLAFRDDGVFKKYGEYIGSVAQQHDMQSSRRLTPYPFTYNTVQMMLKDGGVCGTMGNISARSHCSLGMPACTAGQPGHCAVVGYRFFDADAAINDSADITGRTSLNGRIGVNHNVEEGTYTCKGSQYATGGDEKTTPHARWLFTDEYEIGRASCRERVFVCV